MAQQNIAYDDKVGIVNNPALDVNKVTEGDMNEIKGVVNANATDTQSQLDLKAPLASPTFTGTVSGITATMVGLGNVDNTADADKPVSTLQATAIADKVSKSETADQNLASKLQSKGFSAGASFDSRWQAGSYLITVARGLYMYYLASAEVGIVQNAYYDGAWKYDQAGTALRTLYGSSGSLTQYTSASGSADGSITWIPTQTFDVSGNLKLDQYTTAGALVNDTSGNVTSDADIIPETGTFTPTLTTSGVDFTSVTYGVQVGEYQITDGWCYGSGRIRTNAVTIGSATGNVYIDGLPATPASGSWSMNIGSSNNWAGSNPIGGVVSGALSKVIPYSRATFDGNVASVVVADVDTGASKNDIVFDFKFPIA